jgi:hypothetical protein
MHHRIEIIRQPLDPELGPHIWRASPKRESRMDKKRGGQGTKLRRKRVEEAKKGRQRVEEAKKGR